MGFAAIVDMAGRKSVTGKSARRRHGEVGDVADFPVSCRGDVMGLSRGLVADVRGKSS